MLQNFSNMFSLFSAAEKRKIGWLFLAMLIMGLLEMVGVASIAPFTAVASNPEIIRSNPYLHIMHDFVDPGSDNDFLFVLGLLVLIMLTFSNAFSALTTWALLRFSNMQGHYLSETLFIKYLSQPYTFFLDRNSAELSKNMFSEVGRVIVGVLDPGLQVAAKSVIIICILTLLIIVDPFLAVSVMLVLSSAYFTIFYLARRKITKLGKLATILSGERYKAASEAFGSIKELKLLGREQLFVERYSRPSHELAIYNAISQTFIQLPRYLLETIAFGGVLLIMLYLLAVKGSLSSALPIIALYTLAGYKLMPALQQVFGSLSMIRYNESALKLLYTDIVDHYHANDVGVAKEIQSDGIRLKQSIHLQNICFSYPGAEKPTLDHLDLKIAANTTVGIVGSTGAGKTTALDVLLGLFIPQTGNLLIDNKAVSQANVRMWQKNLGYVPQSIYLIDDTVSRNISLGVPNNEVDQNRVKAAAKLANLHDFVKTSLPEGYNTVVGEQGVKLSGGQRQRIGIARALYHDPDVLVLDEATSALDGLTENVIMEAISALGSKKTIIIVAHRLATIQNCDCIHVLEKGQLVASGTYSELVESCELFKNMASLANSGRLDR